MSGFADSLKHWRKTRRFSQLDLALEAEVSSRHISFLETGRARPSPEMIGRLSDALKLPLAIRNQLLSLAGFAPRFPARKWDHADMAPVREAITHMLNSHSPFPAFAVDGLWSVLQLNAPAQKLFGMLGVCEGSSMLELATSPEVQKTIENWEEVAYHTAQRLRVESAAQGGVPELDKAAAALSQVPAPAQVTPSPVIPTVYLAGDMRLSLFSTFAQFGTPEDVTLDDLRIEMFFPADAETRQALEAMA